MDTAAAAAADTGIGASSPVGQAIALSPGGAPASRSQTPGASTPQVPRRPAHMPEHVRRIDVAGEMWDVCDLPLQNTGTQTQDRFVAALFLYQGGSVVDGFVRRPPWVSNERAWDICTLCNKHAVYDHLRSPKHQAKVLKYEERLVSVAASLNIVPTPPADEAPPPLPAGFMATGSLGAPPSRPTLPRSLPADEAPPPLPADESPPPLQHQCTLTGMGKVLYGNGICRPGAEAHYDAEGCGRVLPGDEDEDPQLVGPLPADEHDDEGIPPTMSSHRNSIFDPDAEWF